MSWWTELKQEWISLITKDPVPPRPAYRIVKQEWPNGTINFIVERRTRFDYYRDPNVNDGYSFPSLEEAKTALTRYLTPPPEPVLTVVDEVFR